MEVIWLWNGYLDECIASCGFWRVKMLIRVVIWKEGISWRIFRGNVIRDFAEVFSECVCYYFMICVDFVLDNDILWRGVCFVRLNSSIFWPDLYTGSRGIYVLHHKFRIKIFWNKLYVFFTEYTAINFKSIL